MLVDFPNYSRANPWQLKTIQTYAPMEVKVVDNLEPFDCYALHISWEDSLINRCDTPEKAYDVIDQFAEYLESQSLRSKIIWTVHNLTSHTCAFKNAEKKLRAVIMEHASVINLMSMKHDFIVPEKHHSKINIVQHYIEHSHFSAVPKNTDLTFFKYGADRGRKDNELYLKILNDKTIKKYVSDARLNIEIDNAETVITRRRFSFLEADIYARVSNFSTFYQEPKFNSGVMNFLIGQGLAIFHDQDSVAYMDLPQSFDQFCIELSSLSELNASDLQSLIAVDQSDIDEFISTKTPKEVSKAFWRGVYS